METVKDILDLIKRSIKFIIGFFLIIFIHFGLI